MAASHTSSRGFPARVKARMKLTVSDGAAFNKFGWSMSLSQNTLVVGAYGAKIGENEEQGAGYVYYLFESGLYLPVIVR